MNQNRLPIGLIFAGLPAAVFALLNDGDARFFRRADRIDLYAVAVRDVEASFTEMFAMAGFNILPTLIRQASEATGELRLHFGREFRCAVVLPSRNIRSNR